MVSPVYGSGVVPNVGAITNELNAVTRRAFVPKMVVQIYKAAPLLNATLRNAQRAKGGLSAVSVPVQGSSFVAFNWTGYSGSFPQPNIQTAAQTAAWNLSVGTVPVPLLGMESMMQSTEAVVPLVKARMNDATTVAIQSIATSLFGSSGADPLAVNGLLDVYDDGTAVSNYGGIARAGTAGAFWRSTKITTGIGPTRNTMITRIMQATSLAGGESPDLVVMSLGDWCTLLTDFMTVEQFNTMPGQRYGNDDAVNAGFRCLMLGNTPIIADPFCPNGRAFIINTKYLAMYLSEYANFAWSGFHSLVPNNQLASVGVVIIGLALACTKPSSGLQLANITGAAF